MESMNDSNLTVGWVSDPNGRGTSSLIVTCLVTLGLCVWSAVHLSIPKRNESSFQDTLQYVKWCIIGIFGPELVVFAAWRQYISAQALLREVQDHRLPGGSCEPIETSTTAHGSEARPPAHGRPSNFSRPFRRVSTCLSPQIRQVMQDSTKGSPVRSVKSNDWSLTHGFYAGMGGFVFDIDEISSPKLPNFVTETCDLTLTARGVALLCRCGLLPQIRQSEILDKSKSDRLAKLLACLQAAWMVAQVISRLHCDLPITLLEVNTLGHVFCAFVIYLLWWNKPKWIKEPTRLQGDWVRPIAAFMYMSSKLSGLNSGISGHVKDFVARSELSALIYVPADAQTGLDAYFTPKPQHAMEDLSLDRTSSLELATLHASVQHPSTIQLERWRLAAQAVQTYPAILARFENGLSATGRKNAEALRMYPEMPTNFRRGRNLTQSQTEPWLESSAEQLVTGAAGNWPDDDLLRGVAGLMMGVVLWFASMAFGAVHAAAWSSFFSSEVEAWLWRSSALYIAFAGLLWLVVNMLSQCSRTIWWYWYDLLLYRRHWLHYVCWGTVCAICGLAYVFARLFLVVEAFISLRSLPVGAYQTPQWTNGIPHL